MHQFFLYNVRTFAYVKERLPLYARNDRRYYFSFN